MSGIQPSFAIFISIAFHFISILFPPLSVYLTNFSLAPWGEGVRRTGEGLNIILRLIHDAGTKGVAGGFVNVIHGELTVYILAMGVNSVE